MNPSLLNNEFVTTSVVPAASAWASGFLLLLWPAFPYIPGPNFAAPIGMIPMASLIINSAELVEGLVVLFSV